jgi:hypothetical protein
VTAASYLSEDSTVVPKEHDLHYTPRLDNQLDRGSGVGQLVNINHIKRNTTELNTSQFKSRETVTTLKV